MPSLPRKSVKGAVFKKWVVESIDKLIDYLSSTYIQVGQGLRINRTPSGMVIELEKQNTPSVTNISGGTGGASGLIATVSGGTATVDVSGSNPLVIEPANGNVFLSGGTNGELQIGASVMSAMPNYLDSSAEFISVDSSAPTIVPSQAQAMWLVGYVGVNTASNMSGTVQFSMSTFSLTLFDLTIASGSSLSGLTVPVILPIPAGHSFQLMASGAALGNFHLYPTI